MHILVNDTTKKILCTRSSKAYEGAEIEDGCSAVEIDGDVCCGGTYDNGSYVAFVDPINWAERHSKFRTAYAAYLDGTLTVDARWKRCVSNNDLTSMSDADWTALEGAY